MTNEIADLHRRMIDGLVTQGCLRDTRVAAAFRAVRRHLFLPDVPLEQVYSGESVVTRRGPDGLPTSSSSEPAVMAVMLEQVQVGSGDRVLEIGAGTGYNAALLAHLAGDRGAVTAIDLDEEIANAAREGLRRAGLERVEVRAADGWLGAPDRAPFDAIEATVGVADLSPHWVDQLREGGRLVVPLWLRAGLQASVAFVKTGTRLTSVTVRPAGFMRLRGPHAGPERYVRIGGWIASLESEADAVTDALRDLLATSPRAEPAPLLMRGWSLRMALYDPNALSLTGRDDWRHWMAGILDVQASSLACVEGRWDESEGRRILVYGGDAALSRLHRWLRHPLPLDLRALSIVAIPAGEMPPSPGRAAVEVERPCFRFLVREEGPVTPTRDC